MRKEKNKNRLSGDEIPEGTYQYDPHVEYTREERKQLILKLVNGLPDKQKEVFLLRHHSGMKFSEIAEVTAQPLNTVLSHMHYAVDKIKQALEEIDAESK